MQLIELFLCCYQVWLGRRYYSADCIWILVPRLIIHSQSGNDTNVNIHVGFSRWGVTVYCSRSVYGSASITVG